MRKMFPKCFGFPNSEKQPSTVIEELCHRFCLAQIKKATNNFDKSQIIGAGRFGTVYSTVYKGCILVNGEAREVAIKRLYVCEAKEIAIERLYAKSRQLDLSNEFKNEIVLLCQLRHHNLVSLIGFCEDKNEMIPVYEYLSNGSLYNHLHGEDNYEHIPRLSWKKRLEICIGAARGLHYLHTGAKHTIIHCNVKPSRILLDENWVPKIADFGFSLRGPSCTSKHPKPKQVDRICGTYGYMAPEYEISGIATEKIDVFSFGMVLLEMACATKPHMMLEEMKNIHLNDYDYQVEGKSEYSTSLANLSKKVHYLVQNNNVDEIIDPLLKGKTATKCLELFMGIVKRCLHEEATERPTMGEVEMQLELALQLQEEADANLHSGCEYSLISNPSNSS